MTTFTHSAANSLRRRLFTALMSVFAVCSLEARADFVGHPVTGAAIVTNGQFTNIYVYPSSDTQTWEEHLASLPAAMRPSGDFSRAHIDQFTSDIMSGWPGYFDPLMQYRTISEQGIAPPAFLGSLVASKACVDAALHDAVGGVVQWATMRTLANCHLDGHDPSPQVNLIVSPDIKVASPNVGPDSSPDMCTVGTSAYHAWGLNVPNFTVTSTNPACNGNFDSFTESMTHEFAELLSDPAGFGYTHDNDYTNGEIGDICQANPSAPKNPTASPAIAYGMYRGYAVSRYWSEFDGACMPHLEGPDGTDSQTWVLGVGTPLARLTGSNRDLTLSLPEGRTTTDAPLLQLRLFVKTGIDDLRGDTGNMANATVHFRSGDSTTINLSASRRWDSDETHVAVLNVPAGAKVSDITGLTIHKDYDGGFLDCCGDNWDLAKVALVVSYATGSSVTVVRTPTTHEWLNVSGGPLVRFTGDTHDHTEAVAPQDLGSSVQSLTLIITTGGDDLRGGGNAGDNCDVTLTRRVGDPIVLHNVNAGQHWGNGEIHSIDVPVPAGLMGGDITAVTLHTGFGGGVFGDNWNVERVQLEATLLPALGCSTASGGLSWVALAVVLWLLRRRA
jgi:hypothetical protein